MDAPPAAYQVGIPGGNAEITLPLQDVVFGQKAVTGSIVGGRADMQVCAWVGGGGGGGAAG